jgi:menaquinone-dependent protoporphyrinogen oxidase
MKPIAVFYATREGQTEKIATRIAADLAARGFDAEVSNVAEETPRDLVDRYAGAVVAASVHAGTHEPEMVRFVRERSAQLERIPAAFVSVSLSEAGAEDQHKSTEERAKSARAVQGMIDAFLAATGWHPSSVKPVAGALAYTRYNFFVRFIMKRIARKEGGDTDTSRDHEYTDWVELDHFVDAFAANVLESRAQVETTVP